MKFLSRTSLKEKIILFVVLIIFITSTIGLVYFDKIFFKPVVAPEDRIGRLEKRRGSVDRRTPEMFEFIGIFVGDPIGNGDAIFTGESSSATVRLQEDSTIFIAADSLVVFREKNGKFNIKIEKGEVSGNLSKDTEIEFQTEEEAIILDGEEFSRFTLSYDGKRGIEIEEITSVGKRPSKPAEKNADNPDSQAKNRKRSRSQNPSSEPSKATVGVENVPTSSKQLLQRKSKPVRIQSGVKVPDNITNRTYSAPYPKLNQVLLIKNATKVVLLPKSKCKQSCLVTVKLNQKVLSKRRFAPDRIPILTVPIGDQDRGVVQWTLEETEQKPISGNFEVRPFNMNEFGKALKAKKNIEVID